MALLRPLARAAELLGVAVAALGVFMAFGPYQDDGTWNLMRNTARAQVVEVPGLPPTHFRLREVTPLNSAAEWEKELDERRWRRQAPPVLFVPGHNGNWKQVINIAAYLDGKRPLSFFAVDFHASASALHGSVVAQQAVFVAEAMLAISALYAAAGRLNQSLTVVGHSMGGVVAQEALRLLREEEEADGEAVQVNAGALILVSTPVFDHPLLLERRLAGLAGRLRRALWADPLPAPQVVAIAAGETDPLMPGEVAALPRSAAGISLMTPAMHNVHATFSHVNLLFARHFLHAAAGLVAEAADGRLLQAARVLRSPLAVLVSRPEPTLLEASLADLGSGKWELVRGGAAVGKFTPEALAGAAGPASEAVAVALSQMAPGKTYALPAPAPTMADAAFTLVVFERPKSIRRARENTTRGEDFNDRDQINCSTVAEVDIVVFLPGGGAQRAPVAPAALQYPAKSCVFHAARPPQAPVGAAVVAVVRRPLGKTKAIGWAQWHADQLAEMPDDAAHDHRGGDAPAVFGALGGPLDWARRLLAPARVALPPGRALVVRLDIQLGTRWAPYLPIDIRVVSGTSSHWGLRALLVAGDVNVSDVRVAALREDPAPQQSGWAAESAPNIFAPRFTPGRADVADGGPAPAWGKDAGPQILVVADPTSELVLEVRANGWALLGRCFRTHLGHILAAWLGATLALHPVPRGVAGGFPSHSWGRLCLWAAASSALLAVLPEPSSASAETGYCPGTPPGPIVLFIHAIGALLAHACRSAIGAISSALAEASCCCRRPRRRSSAPAALLDVAAWSAAALAHPAFCVLGLGLRSLVQLAALLRRREELAHAEDAVACATGLCALLGLYLLCHAPSLVLTLWVLLGQHRESSTAMLQKELLNSLPTSRHAPTPLVDSWLFERRAEVEVGLLPALALLPPILGLACRAAAAAPVAGGAGQAAADGSPPAAAAVGPALARMASRVDFQVRLVLLQASVAVVWLMGHRTQHLGDLILLALTAHAAAAAAACAAELAGAGGRKSE